MAACNVSPGLFAAAAVALAVAGCADRSFTGGFPADQYRAYGGPLDIITVNRTVLPFPEQHKELSMRMAFPASGGPYPVIVFSHGNGCTQDLYAGFADHWASWGYAVIQPVHADSRNLGFTMKGRTMEEMNVIVDERRADVRHILDSFPQLEAQVPGLRGKLDSRRLIAAGHSMGAGTAMVLTGVQMVSPMDGTRVMSDENRFAALILISEPSNNSMMPEEPWRFAGVPTFIATGSNDYSGMGARDGKKSPNAWQLPADISVQDQPRWYLYMADSDHYLGGAICKDDVPGPPDSDAVRIINGTSTAFLEAYVRDNAAARAFLGSSEIQALTGGRAVLDNRQ